MMAFGDAVAQLAGSAVLILRQRLEIAALDVEEELLRLGLLFLVSIAAVLLAGFGCAALAGAVLVHYWDSARLGAIFAVAGAFAAASAGCAAWVLRASRAKPGLLHGTLGELACDEASLGGRP
jgi:uncharacterized membrane protein YqjE